MLPVDLFLRLPPATALLVFSAIFRLSDGHAIPLPTKTVNFHELDVASWPIAPTTAPDATAQLHALFSREFNTVCGYIGGDASLPATCSAGSHCVVDKDQGAIGCCPNEGSCTQGVFTGCVDANSGPLTEANPYVFTCGGGNVCYKNSFEGGYFQYGCGSASNLAATVALSAPGRSSLDIISISIPLTATATSLTEPITLSKVTSESSDTATSITSTEEISTTSETSTITSETTSTTGRPPTSSTSTTTTSESFFPTAAPPNGDDSSTTGAIIGGTIGGIAGAFLIIGLGIFLWRRRRGNTRQGPGPGQRTEFIKSPNDQNGHHAFAPLPTVHEIRRVVTPPPVSSPGFYGTGHQNEAGDTTASPLYRPDQACGYQSGAITGGVTVPGVTSEDEVPLTARERDRELDDFSRGFNSGLQEIREEEYMQPSNSGTMSLYSGHQRSTDGNRPLWQQSRNPLWM